MATETQKRAVDILVGNGGNVSKAMREAGYREATVNTPQKLTESKGFQELMEEYGLTKGLIVKALVEDIKDKPKRRIRELELGADILKLRGQDSGPTNSVLIIQLSDTSASRYAITQRTDTDSR